MSQIHIKILLYQILLNQILRRHQTARERNFRMASWLGSLSQVKARFVAGEARSDSQHPRLAKGVTSAQKGPVNYLRHLPSDSVPLGDSSGAHPV